MYERIAYGILYCRYTNAETCVFFLFFFLAVFEVVFWCHVLPFFKSCSSGLESTPLSSMAESSAFSTILLRYKASNRYLCMDKRGKIYSLPLPVRRNSTVMWSFETPLPQIA